MKFLSTKEQLIQANRVPVPLFDYRMHKLLGILNDRRNWEPL